MFHRKAHASNLTTRSLSLRAATANDDERTVQAVLATENPASVYDYAKGEVIDEVLRVDGAEFGEQIVLLAVHQRYSLDNVLGSIREMRVEGSELVGKVRFAKGDEQAERAWVKVKQGHLTDMSVGYRELEYVDIPIGESKKVNGQEYTAKNRMLRVVTRWPVKEVSLVPIGADEAAKIREEQSELGPERSLPVPPRQECQTMNVLLRDYLQSLGLRTDATAEEAWSFYDELGGEKAERARALRGMAAVEKPKPSEDETEKPKREETTPEPPDENAIRKQERERIVAIRELGADPIPAKLVEQAVNDGWSVERASPVFLKALQDARKAVVDGDRVEFGSDGGDRFREAVVDGITMRTDSDVPDANKRKMAHEWRGIGFRDLARAVLGREGVEIRSSGDELFKRAISSGDYTELLGTAATKTLRQGYMEYPGTLVKWADQTDAPDFKVYKNIRLSAFASLPEVGDAGEIAHGELKETYEESQVKTYGTRFAVTRKQWINDDLGAFTRIPAQLGMAAARNIDDVGYALLYSASGVGPTLNEDALALFATTHAAGANYFTGATASKLDDTGLTAGRKLMRLMKGMNGEQINVMPRFILVPAALEQDAWRYVAASANMIMMASTATDGSVATEKWSMYNPHAGQLAVIVEPRLDGATNGTTAWYLIADPSQAGHMNVVYLRGQRTPVVERKDPVDVLGIGWWMYHDVGVAVDDFRGIVRAKGA